MDKRRYSAEDILKICATFGADCEKLPVVDKIATSAAVKMRAIIHKYGVPEKDLIGLINDMHIKETHECLYLAAKVLESEGHDVKKALEQISHPEKEAPKMLEILMKLIKSAGGREHPEEPSPEIIQMLNMIAISMMKEGKSAREIKNYIQAEFGINTNIEVYEKGEDGKVRATNKMPTKDQIEKSTVIAGTDRQVGPQLEKFKRDNGLM